MKHIWHFAKSIHSYAGRSLYVNLIGMIMISLFESIGIFLLIPLLSLTGVFHVQSEKVKVLAWIQSMFARFPVNLTLLIILTIYILLITGQSFLQRKQILLNTKIQQGYLRHLRDHTYKSIMHSNWSFFLRKRKTDLIDLMIIDIARVNGGILMLLQFIASLVFTFIQVGVAFWLSAKMTIAILLFGFAIIFLSRKLIKKSSRISEETVELGRALMGGITDHFNGIKDIKSNTLEEMHIKWFRLLGTKLDNNIIEMANLNTISQFIFKVISAFLMAGFVFYSIKMFRAQPAQLMLIMAIFTRLWPRFSSIQSNLQQIWASIPSFKNLIDLQNECLIAQEIFEEPHSNLEPLNICNELECRNVSFRYNLTESKFALKDINVTIPSNKMTAVVGRSGAGKSTLIDLLMGLNQPEKGQVLIDGTLLTKDNLLALRRSVSYVPQDPFLFNTTVRENLLLMKPEASEEQLWEALKFAASEEFVMNLPQKLDTLIGDRGIKLSGGERQRLVLARAILKKPSILILDEATSALDSENEAKIQEALKWLNGKMTMIVIAHRLSTIRHADQVIVLDQGSVVQTGQYAQLANDKRGMFSHLLTRQLDVQSQ